MYLCLDCYEVYDDNVKFENTYEWNYCPKTNCSGHIVEIDELFIPVIIELNKRGYITKHHCSGHVYNSCINSYISFEEYVELPNLPKGYKYDKDLYPHVNWERHGQTGMDCIRINFDENKNKTELSKDIYQNAINVLEWVNGLEVVEW